MIWLATRTMELLDQTIARDGGNAWRAELQRTLPTLDDAYRADEDSYRTHLGASVLGAACERSVWYGWRWAYKRPPTGRRLENPTSAHARMMRLYNRGHLEEGRFVALLRVAGIQVYQYDEKGHQYRISDFGGHFGGAIDSALVGVPDLPPGVPCLGEFKTHNDKSFKILVNEGVREAKPEHYTQMQVYMRRMGLLYALYLAVNKNDDEMHGEMVQYDSVVSDGMMERARRIVFTPSAPDRVRRASPGYFICKMCDHKEVCFSTEHVDRNCRTCRYSEAMPTGEWCCTKHGHVIDKAAQQAGCEHYNVHPDLIQHQ